MNQVEIVSNRNDAPANLVLAMTAHIISAYVQHNPIAAAELPRLIKSIHRSLGGLSQGKSSEATEDQKPAVPVKKSVTPDYVICLEDGKKLKMLKRYLRSRYGLSPEDYRAKWNLPPEYPMVAPNYAASRSAFAKKIGLGRIERPAKERRRVGRDRMARGAS